MYEFGLGLTCDIRTKPQVLWRWELKECRRGAAVSAFGCFFGVTAHANMETIAILQYIAILAQFTNSLPKIAV